MTFEERVRALETLGCPRQKGRFARFTSQRRVHVTVTPRTDDLKTEILVPFGEDEKLIFLKTIIPSRKATKEYVGEEPEDHET